MLGVIESTIIIVGPFVVAYLVFSYLMRKAERKVRQ